MTSPTPFRTLSRPGSAWSPEIAIVDEHLEFEALRRPWERLDSQAGVRPFQQFGWAAAWMDSLGRAGNYRLCIGTLWDQGTLVAVLPLCIRRYKGVRMLEWIGARITDYCDALVDRELDCDWVLPVLWQAILRRGGFDVARLSHVRTDAAMFAVLDKSKPWVETLEDASGVTITWASGEQWLAQRTKRARDRILYRFRTMQKAGFELRIREILPAYGEIIDALIAQKRVWLTARGSSGFIDQPEGREFLRAAVDHFAARGELCLSTVRKDGHIAAVDLTFIREGVLYSYMASFDPRYARYSLGMVLTDRLLMWACDNGCKRFDLLLGAYEYKSRYGCTLEPVRTLVIAQGLLGSAALSLYRRSVSRARQAGSHS